MYIKALCNLQRITFIIYFNSEKKSQKYMTFYSISTMFCEGLENKIFPFI